MCPSAVTSVMCCEKKLIIAADAAGAAGTLFFSPNRSREGNGNGTRPRSCFPMSDVPTCRATLQVGTSEDQVSKE